MPLIHPPPQCCNDPWFLYRAEWIKVSAFVSMNGNCMQDFQELPWTRRSPGRACRYPDSMTMISIPREIPMPVYQCEIVDVLNIRSHRSALMIGTKVFATLREFNTTPFSSATRHLLAFNCLFEVEVTESEVIFVPSQNSAILEISKYLLIYEKSPQA